VPLNEPPVNEPPVSDSELLDDLGRSLTAVGVLIDGIRPDQWTAPTPCSEWDVQRLVAHLLGMNLVFAAMLADLPRPERGDDLAPDELRLGYRNSSTQLRAAFAGDGVMEREYTSPLGAATGRERLQIRLYDLLAHGWDLARATDQHLGGLDAVAEQSLRFVEGQLEDDSRPGRFAPAQDVPAAATALDRLAAFLGRHVG
jgi:uncharacterized protein (TIGR03086 family)